MDASPVRIFEYFNGEKQSLIPLFQRPYSWTKKDWLALWNDILLHYDPEVRSSHFMGAVVSVPAVSKPVGVTKHFVIDGQQRLTTLSILLAAIREKALANNDERTVNKIQGYLKNPYEDAPDDLKLVPTQVDREVYKALILDAEIDAFAESRIVQAYRFFSSMLDGEDEDGLLIDAKTVLDTICQALQVVMINLSANDDPYLIFESLNHKGEPLTQSDLVRNYVLMRFQHTTSAGGEQERVYHDLWRPMEDMLGQEMSEFMRHYVMRHGKNVRKNDIYSATKATFQGISEKESVKKELESMRRGASAYRKFLRPEEFGNARVRSKLSALHELDTKVFYPLILRLTRAVDEESMTVDDLVGCLGTLESFYVRRSICGVPTNALNKICLELCSQFPEQNVRRWLFERLSHGQSGRRWPDDEEFKKALIEDRVYQRKKIVRFLLVQLESAQEHREPADPNEATIEHILPQTLGDEWRTALGERADHIHDRWRDTLGNLTLTAYNSELGNLPFEVKKRKLNNTHFEITRWVLAKEKWSEAEILERAEWLASTALDRWPREGDGAA